MSSSLSYLFSFGYRDPRLGWDLGYICSKYGPEVSTEYDLRTPLGVRYNYNKDTKMGVYIISIGCHGLVGGMVGRVVADTGLYDGRGGAGN